MELTHDQYYLRKLTRDYGENFFSCSGFIACSISFILFIITVSIYMSFCLIQEDLKHEMEAKSTSEPEKKKDSKDKTHHNSPTKDKEPTSSTNASPLSNLGRPYAVLRKQLMDPTLNDLHQKTVDELNKKFNKTNK